MFYAFGVFLLMGISSLFIFSVLNVKIFVCKKKLKAKLVFENITRIMALLMVYKRLELQSSA